MPQKIVHLTDPHFGNQQSTYDQQQLNVSIIDSINEIDGDKILIISGDITYKANSNGYHEAQRFFNALIDNCDIDRSKVIACPGNHDIAQNPDPFSGFNKFIYSLRKDNHCNMKKNNEYMLSVDDTIIIVCNSSYHLNREFGLVPDSTIELLNNKKNYIEEFKNKIFVTHHHLIGVHKDDTSAIRNAHQLISALDGIGFNYILHGHQHTLAPTFAGSAKIKIESGRSFNFHDKGYHNGFNVIDIDSLTTNNFIASPDTPVGKITFKVLS